jgi:hypothetical protein
MYAIRLSIRELIAEAATYGNGRACRNISTRRSKHRHDKRATGFLRLVSHGGVLRHIRTAELRSIGAQLSRVGNRHGFSELASVGIARDLRSKRCETGGQKIENQKATQYTGEAWRCFKRRGRTSETAECCATVFRYSVAVAVKV